MKIKKELLILLFLIMIGVGTVHAQASTSVPLYRMYNSNSGEHFYTENLYEATSLHSVGWNYEGIESYEPVTGGAPVYRLYNPNAGVHFYTTNAYEKQSLVNRGWRYELIAFVSGGNIPIYRAYNAHNSQHNYTTSAGEQNNLTRLGWSNEGIAFYANAYGNPNDNTISRQPVWHSNFLYQNDPRWANVSVGDSTLGPEGCGPTSIAMILNGYGANYNPVQIARTANQIGNYNNPNIPGDGIDGQTVVKTLNYYGMQTTQITAKEQLINELRSNKPVIYGMEWLYTYPRISHFVILSGYNNGYTTVHDPLNRITGSNSVERLWSHPSQLSDDWNAGRPAWSVLPK